MNSNSNSGSIQEEKLYNQKLRDRKGKSIEHKSTQTDPQAWFQTPMFNFHFHIPQYDGSNHQVFLPGIQPIIHVHCNDVARALEVSSRNDEESTYKMFKHLLSMTSTNCVNVKIHNSDKLREKELTESEVLRTTPSCSQSICTDINLVVNRVTENQLNSVQKDSNIIINTVSETSQNLIQNNSNVIVNTVMETSVQNNSEAISSHENRNSTGNVPVSVGLNIRELTRNRRKRTATDLEKIFKLKKAAVVLTDICKSKYYKNWIAASSAHFSASTSATSSATTSTTISGLSNEPGKESFNNAVDRVENLEGHNSQQFQMCCVKREIESPDPELSSQVLEKCNGTVGSSTITSSKEVESESDKSEYNNSNGSKSLVSLVEGCSFSEILHRFKVKKCEKYLADSVKNLIDTKATDAMTDIECSSKVNEHSYHKIKLEVNEGDTVDNLESGMETQPNFQKDFESNNMINFDAHRDVRFHVTPRQDLRYHMDGNLHSLTNPQSEDNKIESFIYESDEEEEEEEVTELFKNQKIIRATTNSEIEILSCSTSPFLIPINRFKYIRPDEINGETDSTWHFNTQLELIRKEMARRQKNNSKNSNSKKSGNGVKKKSLKAQPSEPSPQSRTLRSDKQKTGNSLGIEEYIPLEATGPTRFAVAPLDKVTPYKSHNSRNFKNEMLFGNRVNRFPSSNHLQIYKMKKNAGRTSSD